MKTMTFTEFRSKASEAMDLVEQGETIRVLRHGRPIAKIVPEQEQAAVPAWKLPALRLVIPGVSLSDAIIEERESGM